MTATAVETMAKRAMKVRLNIGECMMGEAEEWMREVRVCVWGEGRMR